MSRKKSLPRDLYRPENADSFLRCLRGYGIDLQSLIDRLVVDPDVAILLGGSIAGGFANEASDIDIILLTETFSGFRGGDDVVSLVAGKEKEILYYKNGVEINIEVIDRRLFLPVVDKLNDFMPVFFDKTVVKNIPLLDRHTIRTLHNIRTGVILSGHDVVDEWREYLYTDSLPLYLSVLYLVFAHECLEDLNAQIDPLGRKHIYFDTIMYALLSVAALAGFTATSFRFVHLWLETCDDQSAKGVIREGQTFLFDIPLNSDDCPLIASQYVRNVRAAVENNMIIREILSVIFQKIDYV